MAPTTTTNSSIPLPTGEGFAGDEFSNNLFSDLAPLLTLFGEQVTKQFLSMSMGWADDVLLAMGPLGIMTVIVSAIRVSGIKTLKAFVGRLVYDNLWTPHQLTLVQSTRKQSQRRERDIVFYIRRRVRALEWPRDCSRARQS
jgi:hypothetical protein